MAKEIRRFAVFDIDGTLIRWQLYHAIVDSLAKLGHADPKKHQIIREARMRWKRRKGNSSFKSYEEQLIAVYEQILAGLTFEQFEEATSQVFTEYKEQVYTYTRELVSDLKKKGYLLFAISGSQAEIVSKIARHYGFDEFVGTIYERGESGFTGSKTIGSADKSKTLRALIEKRSASLRGSIAVGDSASDISMLELVEKAVAFNPERALFEHALRKGWKVVVERKNVIYVLEKHDGRYQLVKTSTQ